MNCKVIVLAEGYSRPLGAGRQLADCSCTLVLSTEAIVLVDTLGPWARQRLLDLLAAQGIHPEQVTHVIGTHGHPDHIGNLNLFTGVDTPLDTALDTALDTPRDRPPAVDQPRSNSGTLHIVGQSVYQRDEYRAHDFAAGALAIRPGLRVVATPGHTLGCVSLVCDRADQLGRVAVAGDLFENRLDLQDEQIWLQAGSESPQLQRASRAQILRQVDHIVPGHGSMFRVKEHL